MIPGKVPCTDLHVHALSLYFLCGLRLWQKALWHRDKLQADFSIGPHAPWISCDSCSTDLFSLELGLLGTSESKMQSQTQKAVHRASLNK